MAARRLCGVLWNPLGNAGIALPGFGSPISANWPRMLIVGIDFILIASNQNKESNPDRFERTQCPADDCPESLQRSSAFIA